MKLPTLIVLCQLVVPAWTAAATTPSGEAVVDAAVGEAALLLRADGRVVEVHSDAAGRIASDELFASDSWRDVVAVAYGEQRALLLLADGALYAQATGASELVSVSSSDARPLAKLIAIAAGDSFGLALDAGGNVWTLDWERSARAAPNAGSSATLALRPVRFGGAQRANVTAIAAGQRHALALASDGSVWSWGDNESGQLGDGTFASWDVPVQVRVADSKQPLSAIVAMAAGASHSLALDREGVVWGWGGNGTGALGDGTLADAAAAVRVDLTAAGPIRAIASGDGVSFALAEDGRAWSWGDNRFGQLGDGSRMPSNRPVQVVGPDGSAALTEVLAIRAQGSNALALRADGSAWIWGRWWERGDARMQRDPTVPWPLRTTAAESLGQLARHDVLTSSSLSTIGVTTLSEDPSAATAPASGAPPTELRVRAPVLSAAAGIAFSLAAQNDGTVWAWGQNEEGQLGDGSFTDSPRPRAVVHPTGSGALTGVIAVAAGHRTSFALKTDGTVWSWGSNESGALGIGSVQSGSSRPVPVVGPGGIGVLTGIVAIAGNKRQGHAVRNDGTVWSWGDNRWGGLGDGTRRDSPVPVQVIGPGGTGFLSGIVAVGAGGGHAMAQRNDGTVWSWGANHAGQLGIGVSGGDRLFPVQALGPGGAGQLTGIVQIRAGAVHSLAVRNDGTAWAWGNNGMGELGNGTTTASDVPVQVRGPGGSGFLSGVVALAAGERHSMAIRSDGSGWGWGFNGNGQLGDGTLDRRPWPVQILGPFGVGTMTNLTAMHASQYHSIAVRSDGTAYTWGYNRHGQLGDASSSVTGSSVPVRVAFLPVELDGEPRAGDFDGDGRVDLVRFNRDSPIAFGHVFVSLSNGSGFGTSTQWHDFFAINRDEWIVIGDFDGDGKDDVATWLGRRTRQVYVALSTGSRFGLNAVWLDRIGFGDESEVLLATDADGDGRDDLVWFGASGDVDVARSTGTAFAPATRWHSSFAPGQERVRVGDCDGDGRGDILSFGTTIGHIFGDVHVALSMGGSFGPGSQWHDFFSIQFSEVIGVGDRTGDGRVDLFTFMPRPSDQVYWTESLGNRFGPSQLIEIPGLTRSNGDEPFVGDVDGDGRADIFILSQSDGTTRVHRTP